ncbi:transporter [Methyloligella sp. 2.7D]|uniref:transporter n=1 Tax=unclassified Methyloligella TaxID=2625955 RepID=UPI001FEF623D|nr:transporter [Methyloligella sp. GL2]
MKQTICGVLAAGAVMLSAQPGHAIDVNSHDWVPLPDGTDLFLNYNIYGTRSEYVDKSGNKTSAGTNLDSFVSLARYVHYTEVAGMKAVVQGVLPVGTLYNAELGGVDLGDSTGFGDPVVAAALWPYANDETKTYLAIEPFLTLPLGQYDESSPVNLGENRWKLDLQFGWYQGLTEKFGMQLTYDIIWYGDNNDAGGGSLTLTQDNTYQFQAWLNYDFAPTWNVAIGYQKQMGGDEYVGGVATGNATERDQGRLELSKFLTPTFQVLGDISHDFKTEGGFAEDFRGTLRLAKVF